jgi:hypothetical protein
MNFPLPRVIAALGLGATLLAMGPAASGTGLTHDSSVTTTIPLSTTTTTTVNSLKTYHEALLAYLSVRKQIAETFKSAVSSARAAYESATASATTGAQRSTARAAYDLAIAQAAAARSAALISLGNPPVRPT